MRQVMLVSFLLCSPHLFAADVVVNFKANLLAMTCTVNIVVGSSKAVNQTIDFGVLTRAELEAQGANTLKDFSLQYSNCTIGSSTNQTVTWMKTGLRPHLSTAVIQPNSRVGITGQQRFCIVLAPQTLCWFSIAVRRLTGPRLSAPIRP